MNEQLETEQTTEQQPTYQEAGAQVGQNLGNLYQPKGGFISKIGEQIGEGIKKGAKTIWDNREQISNTISDIGSRLQSGVHSATGGKYGAAWSSTAAGLKKQHEREMEKQKEAQTWQTGERTGAESFTFTQDELNRGLTREQAELERASRKESQTQAEKATAELQIGQQAHDTAERGLDRAQQIEMLDKQLNESAKQAGLDRTQQKELLELSNTLNIENRKALNDLMITIGNSEDKQHGLMLYNRAMSGISNARSNAEVAAIFADMARMVSSEARGWAEVANPIKQTSTQTAGSNVGTQQSAPKFGKGGFTGQGDKNELAGVVHKGEYVIPKKNVDQKTGVPKLERIKKWGWK
jgi:hypothetical protein